MKRSSQCSGLRLYTEQGCRRRDTGKQRGRDQRRTKGTLMASRSDKKRHREDTDLLRRIVCYCKLKYTPILIDKNQTDMISSPQLYRSHIVKGSLYNLQLQYTATSHRNAHIDIQKGKDLESKRDTQQLSTSHTKTRNQYIGLTLHIEKNCSLKRIGCERDRGWESRINSLTRNK
jgi:hypothetical protein